TFVSGLKLNKSSASLRAGKSLTLKVTVLPTGATNKKVTWKSSNKKYATVNSKGVVTAKKAGIGHTVKITATAADGSGKKVVCKIKIKK
ncbi:MAG: Ig domain-containing protein, partial [Ruminococcus sp.]|nr:Ig domain-containing protein [Ruminococcus sp.]